MSIESSGFLMRPTREQTAQFLMRPTRANANFLMRPTRSGSSGFLMRPTRDAVAILYVLKSCSLTQVGKPINRGMFKR